MLAFFAIFLHIAIPTLYDLAPPAVQGLMETTICAGGESKQVLIDESGKPVKEAPTSGHNCHGCLNHCGALALPAVAALLPQVVAFVGLTLTTGNPLGLFISHAQARAPPL